MLELIEVVSGRLIGPKTWDRNVEIFRTRLDSLWQCMDSLGALGHNLSINCVLVCMRSGMAMEFGSTMWN